MSKYSYFSDYDSEESEYIELDVWKAIKSHFDILFQKEAFSNKFPDGYNKTDAQAFISILKGEISGVTTRKKILKSIEIKTGKFEESDFTKEEVAVTKKCYSLHSVMHFISFLYGNMNEDKREDFKNDINRLFQQKELNFELKEDGEIIRTVSPYRISSEKSKNKNIPLIITEGKTDWKHLKNALKIFNTRGEYKNLENKIEFFEYEKMGMGESRVINRIEVENFIDRHLQEKNKQKLLHMFDRDTKYSKDYRGKEFVKPIDKEFKKFLEKELAIQYKTKSTIYKEIKEKLDKGFYSDIDEEFKSLLRGKDYLEWRRLSNSNVYVFCIPKINDELDEICIEFYYEQDEVKKAFDDGRRLFYGSEFDKDSVSYCKKYMTTKPYPNPLDILDGGDKKKEVYLIDDEKKQNIALSKNEFTQNIIDGVEGFNKFNIEKFRLIFDVIKNIVKD